MRHLILAVACIGCPSKVPDRPLEAPVRLHQVDASELSPALAPIQWLLGTWQGDHGTEHWVAAAGAFYGIGLAKDGSFEVMIVDDGEGPGKPDGKLRFLAMPGGGGSTQFDGREAGTNLVQFANEAHDYPKKITYRVPSAGQLLAVVEGGAKSESFKFREASAAPAPELEAADRAFAADTAARKIDGWLAAFAPDGGMLRKGKRIEGADAISEVMKDLLASGALAWEPIASGKHDKVGFTVGKATFSGTKPDDRWRSTYVTIWKQQADGAWKVWFDTGRVINE